MSNNFRKIARSTTTTWNLLLRRLRKVCTRACTCVCVCVRVRMIKPNSKKFKTEQFLKHGQNLAGPSSHGANEERNKHASPNSQAAPAAAAEKLTKRERQRETCCCSKENKQKHESTDREVPNAFLIRVRHRPHG